MNNLLQTYSKKLAVMSILSSLAFLSSAQTLWSENSISYLKNTSDFELLGNDNVNVITFEHISGHNWGDTFFFVDRTTASSDANNGKFDSTYGELSPRLSMSYLTNKELTFGPIKDLYIASTWEHNTSNDNGVGFAFNNYLLGLGAAWDISGFAFVNTNLYHASNDNTDNDIQLTLSWGYPFSVGEQNFMLDSFIDWSSAVDDHSAEFHFNPQLKWDLSHNFSKRKVMEVGIEYSYWHNKYGINGLDNQSVVSLLVKLYL
jgi:nucleoside-specific outer membrane channel protein Tsx